MGFLHKDLAMDNNVRRIVVRDGNCGACHTHTLFVHHQDFPEMQIEGTSAEEAAGHLADRLEADLDVLTDPSHKAAVELAIHDIRAFLHREGATLPARTTLRNTT